MKIIYEKDLFLHNPLIKQYRHKACQHREGNLYFSYFVELTIKY